MYHENVIAGQGYESHSFGLFAPQAIILDNDYESVKPYRNHLTSNGISTLLTSKTTIAKDAFMQQGNTAAYIFDMHMRNIHKVGSRDTGRGLAVGVTLVSDITNDGRSNNIKHCATLTEHRTEPSAKISYGVLEKNGQLITRLSKNEKFDEFVEFINIYKNDYLNNIKKNMVLKNFLAISKSFGELSNKDDFDNEIASIMGYTGVNIELWKRNKEIIAENSGNDIQDRVNALIYIKQGIFIHFEKDVSDQKLWIHEPRKELGNKSAWECLISGEMDGINMVASYVNRVIG